ncbi:hypothetical protein [Streptomyces violaceusniger]|uniref:hypothetical protein n=1 Tax=Streptomyces violaceusniger TaxID=68280 RepID=UPI0002F43BA7
MAEPRPVVEPFLNTAVAQGVRRVVLLSSSAVPEAPTGLGALHTLVKETVPEWAVLRPSWFMQNFTGDHAVAHAIRGDGEIVTATGDGKVAFVDATDIAAVATRALLDDRPHNTDHVITGPEALGYAEAAHMVTEVSGRPARHVAVEAGELRERLKAIGIPAEFAAVLAGLDEDIRHGAEDRTTDTVQRVTGRAPRSFRAFAEAHRAAFTEAHPAAFAPAPAVQGLSFGSGRIRERGQGVPPSGSWGSVRPQDGGGSRRGASASDDNAADARARPREPGLIRTTGPGPGPLSGGPSGARGVRRRRQQAPRPTGQGLAEQHIA